MREITERELNWLNSDWIKVAGWIGTFSEDERRAFESLGDACSLCEITWMTQRLARRNAYAEPVIPDDPDLREAVQLMKDHGVPWDRMLPDDYDWSSPPPGKGK
jgi:hypothetical protein